MLPNPCQLIADRTDWSRPELQCFKQRLDQGEPAETVIPDLIGHLRQRKSPDLGYSPAYVQEVRQCAGEKKIAAARERWEKALEPTLFVHHVLTITQLGAETILAAATPELCRRSAEKVLDFQPHWEREHGAFGPVYSICELITYLFPLEECRNDDLVPLFAWLLVQIPHEWARSRTWDELMLGNSGHNWWSHSFHGFWLASLFFPEFKPVQKFAAFYPTYLERELKLLFEPDGWSKEGATGYHQSGARGCLKMAHYAERNNLAIFPFVQERIPVIYAQIWKQLAPDGRIPGFHDDGTNVGLDKLRAFSAKDGNAEAKYAIDQLFPDWEPEWNGLLPLLGENLYSQYKKLVPRPVPPDSVIPDGGYYMMRSAWSPRGDYLAINAGIVGPIVTSHKHMDMFNFVLYSRGRSILADNWYGDCAEMEKEPMVRRWRVGGSAHNVATVDNLDQGKIQQVYRYETTILPLIEDWRSEPGYAYFSASHEGYQRLEQPVSVRRKIFYVRGGYWIMIDRFTAREDQLHDYQLYFQLDTPAELLDNGRLFTSGDGGNLAIIPAAGIEIEAEKTPNPYPIKGYNNPDVLCYRQNQCASTQFVTLMVPFNNEERPAVELELIPVNCDDRILTPFEATALRIVINGQEDFYFDHHMHWNLAWQAGPHAGTERLWHSSMD